MSERVIPVPPGLFRARKLFLAGVLYILGAVLGICAAVFLFLPGSVSTLMMDLFNGGISDPSAILTWTVIHIGLLMIGAACAVCMAIALILERRGKGDGLDLMYNVSRVLLISAKVGGVITLILMVFRLIRFILTCEWTESGIYDAYVLAIAEGVMIVQAVVLFFLLLRFLDCVCDSTASMAYTRASGKLDDRPLPGFCANGILIIAAVNAYLAWDWLATLRAEKQVRIELAIHPMMQLAGGMFLCTAVANLLIGIFLKRYMRITEQKMFCPLQEVLLNE